MLLWLAEALRAVHAVLDAAPVDGVVVLVVQQQRCHHNHVRAVRHRVAEVAQLAVVTGHHCFPIAVAGICWGAEDSVFSEAWSESIKEVPLKQEGVIKVILITLVGAGWI